LPKDAIISSDIGNNCAIGNAYPTFEQGRNIWRLVLFRAVRLWLPSIVGAKIGNPKTPVVGFAGDGAFGISMSEMSSIGRKEWPGITMVIFRNYQWGARSATRSSGTTTTSSAPSSIRARATRRWRRAAV
jgi:sulfoacetaldehyde acetyltransferase